MISRPEDLYLQVLHTARSHPVTRLSHIQFSALNLLISPISLKVFREALSFSGWLFLVLHRPGDGRLQDVLHGVHGLDEHGPVLCGEGGKEGKAISTRTFFGTVGSWRHSSRIAWGSRLSERASEMVALDLPMISTN